MESQAEQSQNRTLWIGDLEDWVDEKFIRCYYAFNNDFVSIKVIRNNNGQSKGFGFMEFYSHDAAARVLEAHNEVTKFPYTGKLFKLNWSASGNRDLESIFYPRNWKGIDNRNRGQTFDIFVGGLSSAVTSHNLKEAFSARYESVKGAEVVMDKVTGMSKGFGFVRFIDELDQLLAIDDMNGVRCFGRPIRVGPATARKKRFEAPRRFNKRETLNN